MFRPRVARVPDLCARIQNGYMARLKSIAVPESKMNFAVTYILYKEGFISGLVRGSTLGPDKIYTPTTPANVAKRRLWLDLKYRDNQPVLHKMRCVSKGSRKIMMNVDELLALVSGRRAKFVESLQPGEIVIVDTEHGVLEIRQAVELNTGGMVLCRVL